MQDASTANCSTVMLLVLMAGCCAGETSAPPDYLPAIPAKTEPALRILTWNVWLMPPITCQSPKNKDRALAIAAEILKCDFDVVCLQKVFDCDAQRVLVAGLESKYKHSCGPANSGNWLCPKFDSGVMVFSQMALTQDQTHEIEFRRSNFIESFARKGAMMVMGDFHNHPFGILTTQLQGEDDPHYTTENADIRRDQMLQIQSELLAPFAKAHPNVPVFLCGDFGTAHLDDSHPPRETAAYLSMINLFGVLNGPGTRITLNDNSWCNELASDDTGRTAELDYIFVPRNDPHLMVDWNLVVMRSGNWDGPGGRHDLSYKYGVAATIKFK